MGFHNAGISCLIAALIALTTPVRMTSEFDLIPLKYFFLFIYDILFGILFFISAYLITHKKKWTYILTIVLVTLNLIFSSILIGGGNGSYNDILMFIASLGILTLLVLSKRKKLK